MLKLVLQEKSSETLVSLIIETESLSRVGNSLLSRGNVAAGAALEVALGGVLGKTSVDGLALNGSLETFNTALTGVLAVRLAVVVQLSRRLALDGLAETLVDVLGGGTADGVLSRESAGSIGIVVGLEGAGKGQYELHEKMN
jgi:hypothetical protein